MFMIDKQQQLWNRSDVNRYQRFEQTNTITHLSVYIFCWICYSIYIVYATAYYLCIHFILHFLKLVKHIVHCLSLINFFESSQFDFIIIFFFVFCFYRWVSLYHFIYYDIVVFCLLLVDLIKNIIVARYTELQTPS